MIGALIGATIGGLIGGWQLTGAWLGGFTAAEAIIGGTIGYTFYDQPKLQAGIQREQIKTQKQIAEQQIAAQERYAGEYLTLTAKQMQLQMGQRRLETLAGIIESKEETSPRIYTLPTKQLSVIDQINQAIGRVVKG